MVMRARVDEYDDPFADGEADFQSPDYSTGYAGYTGYATDLGRGDPLGGVEPLPGGVQPYYAGGAGDPTMPRSATNPSGYTDAVVQPGTPGIDGIPRDYAYVEGRNNADPVSGFATTNPRWQDADRSDLNQSVRVGDDPSSWRYMPLGQALQQNGEQNIFSGSDGRYFTGDNLVNRQMAYMNEQYDLGNPNATGAEMPAGYLATPGYRDPYAPQGTQGAQGAQGVSGAASPAGNTQAAATGGSGPSGAFSQSTGPSGGARPAGFTPYATDHRTFDSQLTGGGPHTDAYFPGYGNYQGPGMNVAGGTLQQYATDAGTNADGLADRYTQARDDFEGEVDAVRDFDPSATREVDLSGVTGFRPEALEGLDAGRYTGAVDFNALDNFDPRAALGEWSQGAWTDVKRGLGDELEAIQNANVRRGRLNTGWLDRDNGMAISRAGEAMGSAIAQKATDAAALKANLLTQSGQLRLSRGQSMDANALSRAGKVDDIRSGMATEGARLALQRGTSVDQMRQRAGETALTARGNRIGDDWRAYESERDFGAELLSGEADRQLARDNAKLANKQASTQNAISGAGVAIGGIGTIADLLTRKTGGTQGGAGGATQQGGTVAGAIGSGIKRVGGFLTSGDNSKLGLGATALGAIASQSGNKTISNIGKGAAIGGTIGSVVPGVGNAVGAGVGAAVGAVASPVKRFGKWLKARF